MAASDGGATTNEAASSHAFLRSSDADKVSNETVGGLPRVTAARNYCYVIRGGNKELPGSTTQWASFATNDSGIV
ncbi:hypothetical protein K0M31_012336 [Melipona bicolor]|uniref:Uncharacterized protein n=1 Tax=Melipona bicolor TaxID=60889 RepID=A0AA40KHD3_9HYME|nr:hypothetical protein K0M31_012336 [Melipona bicolor]